VVLRLDWWKVISSSVGLAVTVTVVFAVVQIVLGYLGVAWFAPLPTPLLGKTYWGVPWGFVSRVVYPSSPYVIEWDYLIYDLIFWFIVSFIYYSIRFRKKP
jgi:hypothetical protein